MRTVSLKVLLWLTASVCWQAAAQVYDTNNVVVQTFAGSGFYGHLDGQGTQTMFRKPLSIVGNSSGDLFVLDRDYALIRKITPAGTVSTFAGGGDLSPPNYRTNVDLSLLGRMAVDHSNVIWATTQFQSQSGFLRIGNDGYVSRTNLSAQLNVLEGGICVDSGNNIYFSGYGQKIFRWQAGGVNETFAGSGNSGAADGNGIFTSFRGPAALAADAADNIYIWDSGNHLIRRINQNRDVVTIAGRLGIAEDSDGVGTNASFKSIHAMVVDDSGNLILVCGSSIRKLTATGNVMTIAGSFTQSGYADGAGSTARFADAMGVSISQGTIFVADTSNQRIRKIIFNPPPQPVPDANLGLSLYPGLQITGTIGRTYRVDSSPDMNTWGEETKLLLTSSPYVWIDRNGVGAKKFYRAFLVP